MRIREILSESNFLGTCVNAFDEDGYCTVPGLYSDTSDFAVQEENAQAITAEQFLKHVGTIPAQVDKEIGPHRIYLYDADNEIFMIYDEDADVHYFFRK